MTRTISVKMLTLLFTGILTLTSVVQSVSPEMIQDLDQSVRVLDDSIAKMSINPRIVTAMSGDKVTVAVTASNVTNLNSWQAVLKYNASIANCSGAWIPEDNVFAGKGFFDVDPLINKPTVDGFDCAVAGAVLLSIASINVTYGILCKLNFTVLQPEQVRLLIATKQNPAQFDGQDLYSAFLDEDLVVIPFDAENGDIMIGPSATLTITTTPGGTTDPAPDTYTYPENSNVSITGVPELGYDLDHWELDTENVSSQNPYSVTMNKNHTIRAVFVIHTPVEWTVDDDGPADFRTIQEATEAASLGDVIFVYNGTYYGSVAVGSFSLVGQSRAGTFIDGNGTAGPVVSLSRHANVSGLTIRNGDYGIEARTNAVLPNYTGNVIDGNNIVDNRYGGIRLRGVSGNAVTNNLIINNSLFGINLYTAGNNTVTNNTIMYNGHGIDFYGCSNDNILRRNNMTNNRYNFGIIVRGETRAWLVGPSGALVNDVDNSNTVDGKPIYYLVNQSGVRVPSDAGCILLSNCSNITIEGCSLANNLQGILLLNTNNALIANNNITSNAYGVHAIGFSSNNTIVGNNLKDNVNGIYLDFLSSFTSMRNNSINGGYMNFGIYPEVQSIWGSRTYRISDLLNDIDPSNTVDGKPIIYWLDQHDRQVPTNAGYVALINSTNILIQGINVRNNVQSILVLGSNNTTIANNSITNSIYGIDVRGFRWQYNSTQPSIDYISFNTTVRGNVLTDNGVGIRFNDYLGTISDNTIRRNPLGIHLRDTYGSTVSGNVVTASELAYEGPYDITIFHDPEPTWERSQELSTSTRGGIVAGGYLNAIQNNTIKNSFVGISLYDPFSTTPSHYNTVFHNNLINNSIQAIESRYGGNYWDKDYPSGGNYWSDYNGTDLKSGPYQNETGNDGVGDEPYEITSSYASKDGYPLMNPYIFGDANHDASVDYADIAIVAKAFGCRPGDSNWNPVADMDLNEVVNIVDVSKVAKEFGKEWNGVRE